MEELYPEYNNRIRGCEIPVFLDLTSKGKSADVVAASIVYARHLCLEQFDKMRQEDVSEEFEVSISSIYHNYHDICERYPEIFNIE